jgi:cytochrome b
MAAKMITWSLIILIVIWIFSNPTGAGSDVHRWVGDLVGFFTHVAKG